VSGILAPLVGSASGSTVSITLFSETVNELGAAPATASYSLQSIGDIVFTNQFDEQFWITPQSDMSDYEVLATLTSGPLTSGTTGVWLGLGTTRTWSITTASGLRTTQFILQLRLVGETTVLASATITLEAEAF
jgi:hypothetical protein